MTEHVWAIENHVCLNCLGRVLSRDNGGQRVYRCSNCGHEAAGEGRIGGYSHPSICCCGARVGYKKQSRNAGIRCVTNDARGPSLLSEIVAREK